MATEYEQQLVSQYGTGMQSLIDAERSKGKAGLLGGVNVDPQDVARITSAFNLNPQGVFSTSNIAQSSSAPVPRPDDLLGIRNQINSEMGIPGLNTQYQNLFSQLNQFDQATNTGLSGLEGQQVSLNVIRGEQAQLERNRSLSREGIAREMQVAQNAMVAAQQEAQQRYAIREQEVNLKKQLILENPGAGITFGDSIEGAASKIQKYQTKVQKEADEKAEKSALKELAMKLGLKTSGSRKDLRKRISKSVKSDKEYDRMMDKIKAASKGSSSNDDAKEEKEFWSTVDNLQGRMENDKIKWSQAWSTLRSRYPEASIETIDNALGLKYRDNYDNND